jgi:hypothetical protein
LNNCKSRSLLLHSIEIGSTDTGKTFTAKYRYEQKSRRRPYYFRIPTFTVDATESGYVVVCKEEFVKDRRLDIPVTFTEEECKGALHKFAGVVYGIRPL